MTKLRIDFGLSADDVLDISDRDGVLLALHLFQVSRVKHSTADMHEVQGV